MLWGGRLKPGESVQIPDAAYVHLFIAKESAELEGADALRRGDAVRLVAAGARRLTADVGTGAEVLIWDQSRPGSLRRESQPSKSLLRGPSWE